MFDARPDAFGPYHLTEEIGTGRFGPAYRAADPAGRPVVVQVFSRGLEPERVEVLASALVTLSEAPLEHPSIARPVAAGLARGAAYLVSAEVPGTTLDDRLRAEGAQPLAEALLGITRIAGALDFAAAVGVHHGTLQPANLLVSDETTSVAGLGVAEALAAAGVDVTAAPPYASPQRRAGLPVSRADDIYALGAITFEILYGRPVPARHALADAVTPLEGVDHVRLHDVLEGTLSDDPADRPSTALEFAGALQRAIVDEAPDVEPAPLPASRSERASGPDDTVTEPAFSLLDGEPEPDLRVERFDEPLVAAAPAASADAGELPLRSGPEPGEGRLDFDVPAPREREPLERAPVPAPSFAAVASAAGDSGGGRWLAVAAALAVGLLTGFAGGFVVGQREAPSSPRAARAASAAPDGQPSQTPAQDFTESTLPDEPAATSGAQRTQDGTPQDVREPEPVPEPRSSAGDEPVRGGGEPRRADTAGAGRVLVRSMPSGARVLVDGEPRGVTPLAVRDLALGAHTIEVTYLGYASRAQRVTLTDARPAQAVDFELRPASAAPSRSAGTPEPAAPGAIQVDSRPLGARVFVDGALVGTTPLLIPKVAAGTHAVRLELQGYAPWTTAVGVTAGARARVAASLERQEIR